MTFSLSVNETFNKADEQHRPLLNTILFIIILCTSIPSICINVFAIYRLDSNRKLSVFTFRTILHVNLLTTVTCIPFFLLELYFNSHFHLPLLLCRVWLVIDYASIVCVELLVCWASIQRHIIIFGPIHIKRSQTKFKFKFIPILVALGLPLIWYSFLASSCKYNQSLYDISFQCRPCFENEKILFLIDTILSFILPLLITFFITIGLLIRIIRLRLKMLHIPIKKWRRCKRLTRQMILFSSIYLIGLVPYVLTNLNSLYNFWPSINTSAYLRIADSLTYVPCCFSSFLSICAFPEIWANQGNRHPHPSHHRHRHRQLQNYRVHESTFVSKSTIESNQV